jgi:acyl carrier protein
MKLENKKKQILKGLCNIFEKKIKESENVNKLENFDSIIILKIISLAKTNYKKNIDGEKISNCKKISDIIDLII